ncbi:MAG: TolC family protein, partial [Bdellovibrionota bacterium]
MFDRIAFVAAVLVFSSTVHAQLLDFQSAYTKLIERDLDLKTREFEVESARARRLRQLGTFLPSLSVDVSQSRSGEPVTDWRQSGAVVASANLFRSGADYAGAKASGRDVDASEETLVAQKQKAEDAAIETLMSYISSRRRREITEKVVALRADSLKVARERYARGILPQQEVDKGSIDLENSRARLTDAEAEEATARASMSAALGTSSEIAIEWPWKEALTSGVKLEEKAFLIQKLPSYRASLSNVEAEDYRRHQARAGLLPSLDFSASYGNENFAQPDRRDWSAAITLSIPLFEKFQGWSATSIQRAAYETALVRREAIIRSAQAEAESLKRSFRAARESALARERTAKVTERLYNDNQQRFRLGRASVNDLAIDQVRLLQSQ